MKRKFRLALSMLLLFSFVFSAVATFYSSALADPPEYTCCWWSHIDGCTWRRGVWIDGSCQCYYGMPNPKNCNFNCAYPICP